MPALDFHHTDARTVGHLGAGRRAPGPRHWGTEPAVASVVDLSGPEELAATTLPPLLLQASCGRTHAAAGAAWRLQRAVEVVEAEDLDLRGLGLPGPAGLGITHGRSCRCGDHQSERDQQGGRQSELLPHP